MLIRKLALIGAICSSSLYSFEIQKGWSLVSIPFENVKVDEFKNQNSFTIWSYDSKWIAYSGNKNTQDRFDKYNIKKLTHVDSQSGYWVYSTNGTSLDNEKYNPSIQEDIYTSTGWNLLGANDVFEINDFNNNSIVWKYQDNKWMLGNNKKSNNFTSFDKINLGEGYWVYNDSPQEIAFDNRKALWVFDENIVPIANANIEYTDNTKDISNGYGFDFVKNKSAKIKKNGYEDKFVNFTLDVISESQLKAKSNNYVVFLSNKSNFKLDDIDLEKVDTQGSLISYILPDYLESYSDKFSLVVTAKPVDPIFSDTSANAFFVMTKNKMDKSITIDIKVINDSSNLSAKLDAEFIKGFKTTLLGSDFKKIDLKDTIGKLKVKPMIKSTKIEDGAYLYALKDGKWEMVCEASYNGYFVKSSQWYDGITEFAFAKPYIKNEYTNTITCKDKDLGKVLKNCISITNSKEIAISNKDGIFEIKSKNTPRYVHIYKNGYQRTTLDLNASIVELKKLPKYQENIKIKYSNDDSLIKYVGDDDFGFEFTSDDFSIVPKLIFSNEIPIYSKVYKYKDGYVFAKSNGEIIYLKDNIPVELINQGGFIYDSLIVENNNLAYATTGGNFGGIITKDDTEYKLKPDDFESDVYDFSDRNTRLAIVNTPIINNNIIFYPSYDSADSMVTADIETIEYGFATVTLVSNNDYGIAGKANKYGDGIIYGTSKSKVIISTKDSVQKELCSLNNGEIVAKPQIIDTNIYIISKDGYLSEVSPSGDIIKSIKLDGSISMVQSDKNLIVVSLNGLVYQIDKDLNILKQYNLETKLISNPIVINNKIFIISKNGQFFVDENKIGKFNSKVISINQIDNNILVSCENGSIWKIKI
jgi:hypothetical protein